MKALALSLLNVGRRLVRRLFLSFWLKHFLGRFQWYRRWHGGRWEYHWIEVCCSYMWLEMRSDRCWPAYRQPCSRGTPLIEDWPLKGDTE